MRILSLLAVSLAFASLAPAQTTCVNRKITNTYVWTGLPSWSQMLEFSLSADGRYVCFTSAAAHDLATDLNGDDDVYLADLENLGTLERVSVSMTGGDGNGKSYDPSVSANGRYVVFTSTSTNLVPGDVEGKTDIFLRDRVLGTTRRLSQTAAGVGGDSNSTQSAISADGTCVAFESDATNLVVPDLAGTYDVYWLELANGTLECISRPSGPQVASSDSGRPALSSDGQRIAFHSSAAGLVSQPVGNSSQIVLHDRATGTRTCCSPTLSGAGTNNTCTETTISADGSFVAFTSWASNLLPADTNSTEDVYIFDVTAQRLELVSVGPTGTVQSGSTRPQLSSDGRFVAFNSNAIGLLSQTLPYNGTRTYVRDRLTGINVHAAYRQNGNWPTGSSDTICISGDGARVVFMSRDARITLPPDQENQPDYFVRDCPFVTPTAFCVANENSLGCAPGIGSTGTPSVSGATPFSVELAAVRSQVSGLLLYSTTGPALTTLFSDYLCVRSPLRRTAVQTSGGTPAGGDCTGQFTFDFGAHLSSGADPALVAGISAWTQFWSRDSGSQGSSHLSNALAFQIQP